MAQNDIGIDLGTTTVIIYMEGKGIVLDEPTIVAVDKHSGRVLAVGTEAYKMVGRTPAHIQVVMPLVSGVISDYRLTREIVHRFVLKIYPSQIVKPRVAVCVPAAITGIESDAAVEAAISAGARQVYLIDEPIAAALGAGIDITRPNGHLVVDIGGGTTDIAVISMGGKVVSDSIRVAGNVLDASITQYVREQQKVIIGQKSAEALKRAIGCCMSESSPALEAEIKGLSTETGMPTRKLLRSEDIAVPIRSWAQQLSEAVHRVLERTPPELSGDIFSEGILITGGGALLRGIADFLSQQLHIKAAAAEDPINCVAIGTGKSLSMTDRLETGFVDATPGIARR